MPKISVIVPIYNKEKYIRTCLDSILAQTLQDIELVAVDDGSPDGCGAICDAYAEKDARVRVIHKPNGGLVSAWKAGVLAAAAEYVGFVDGDDWVDPGYFEELYNAINARQADVAVSEFSLDPEPGARVMPGPVREREQFYDGEEDMRRLIESFFLDCSDITGYNPISPSRCNKLYRRRLFLDNMAFFDERMTAHEDTVANAAMLSDCRRVVLLASACKYHYRIVATSMSHGGSASMQVYDVGLIYQSFQSVVRAKGLEPRLVDIYVGGIIYGQSYRIARSVDGAARRALVKKTVDAAPDALDAYARHRGSLSVRLFCALLRRKMLTPCFWMVRVFEAVKPRPVYIEG